MLDKKPKVKTNTSTLQIRLPLELRQQFNDLCKDKGINSSELIRQLIIQWIEEQLNQEQQHIRKTDLK